MAAFYLEHSSELLPDLGVPAGEDKGGDQGVEETGGHHQVQGPGGQRGRHGKQP